MKFWQRLSIQLFGPRDLELEHQLFNGICLLGGITASLYTIIQAAFNYHTSQLIIILTATFLFYACYIYSYRYRRYRWMIWPLVLFMLVAFCLLWFLNGGSYGGTQYYFFVLLVVIVLVLKGKNRVLAISLTVGMLLSLLILEAALPKLIRPHNSDQARMAEIIFCFVSSIVIVQTIIFLVHSSYGYMVDKISNYKTHFHEDLVLARILQERIFEYDSDLTDGLDLNLYYLPSMELSGDLYDFSRLMPDYFRVFLADARGHGINSSLSSMLIKSEWMSVNRSPLKPGEALSVLNERILSRYGDSIYFSAVIADIFADKITYASGGHIPQYVLNKKGITELQTSGTMLGALEKAEFNEIETPLESGDRLVLYTDALIEENGPNEKPIGDEYLKEFLKKTRGNSEEVNRQILEKLAHMKGQKRAQLHCLDDLTLITVGHADK